jgi:hypothetical protein
MPYVIKKYKDGFKVYKKGTNISFSNYALTKEVAERQKKAIIYHEKMAKLDKFY